MAPEDLLETIKVLQGSGIAYVGAETNSGEACNPVIILKNGIKIGILGFTNNEPEWKAESQKPGTNYIRVGNVEPIKKGYTT